VFIWVSVGSEQDDWWASGYTPVLSDGVGETRDRDLCIRTNGMVMVMSITHISIPAKIEV
jgi:hypothetical protein